MRESHLAGLDGLRGIAATFVIFSHVALFYFPYMHDGHNAEHVPTWGYYLANSPVSLVYKGTAAVFLFFALSGYVLTHGMCGRNFDREYTLIAALKRYLRLGGPVMAAAIFGGIVLKIPSAEIVREAVYGAMLFGDSKSNAVLWTISYEFYGSILVFSLAIIFAKNRDFLIGGLVLSSAFFY